MTDPVSELLDNASRMGGLTLTKIFSGVAAVGLFVGLMTVGKDLGDTAQHLGLFGFISSGAVWAMSKGLLFMEEGDPGERGRSYKESPSHIEYGKDDLSSESDQKGKNLIDAGKVRLNTISPFLSDLPDTAMANLLVAKHDLGNIDSRSVRDSWHNSIKRIEEIRDYFGLYGMRVSNGEIKSPESYEQQWASKIRGSFLKAAQTGKEVVTGLFMPTEQLGKADASNPTGVSISSSRGKIETEGQRFKRTDTIGDYYFTMSQIKPDDMVMPGSPEGYVKSMNFVSDRYYRTRLSRDSMPSRPVALAIQP